MNRYLLATIRDDLARKMVLVTGPRQSGKTTLCMALLEARGGQYFNYDVAEDRAVVERGKWDSRVPLLVFDEVHKKPGWQGWLKGVYDGRRANQQILVTGSARIDT